MPGIEEDAGASKAFASGFRDDATEFIMQDTPVAASDNVVVEEDRENLTTFKSWGTPVTRDKPGMKSIFLIPLGGLVYANMTSH